jgi:hypothetical protein
MSLAGIQQYERLFDRIVPAGLLALGMLLVAAVVAISA